MAFGQVLARGKSSQVSVQIHKVKSIPRAGIKIKFVELVEDSRCPAGVNCVWAGNAKVKIAMTRGRRTQMFELNTNLQPTVVSFEGYDLKLTGLTPKPAVNVRIDPSKYVATFTVDRHRGN